MIQISEDTAAFLLHVLAGVTLNAGAPDFEEAALATIKARRELAAQASPPAGQPRAAETGESART